MPEARERTRQLIKIDVQGFQPEVLAGAQAVVETHRPVLYLDFYGEFERSTARSAALMGDLGYDARARSGLDWPRVPNGTNFVVGPAVGTG